MVAEVIETTGKGFTVIVYDDVGPGQPFAVGVTVIVAVTAVAPVLLAVNTGVFPLPLAPRPIVVLELVHANVVPAVGLVKADAGTEAPLQTTMFAGTTAVGRGLTVMV
jgi:hypothetical protein